MKVIVAGSRDFTDYEYVAEHLDKYLKNFKDIIIVSGGAQGVDALGEEYAEYYGHHVKRFKANWKEHGRAAGLIRNKQMAEYADMLIAFWDGESPGTKDMIDNAKRLKLATKIIRI